MPRHLRCTRNYIELLGDRRCAARAEWRLLRALRRMTRSRKAVVDLLIAALESPNPERRWRAAYLLGNTRQRRAVSALLRRVHDPDPETRNETLEALGALGDPSIVPFLIDLLAELPAEDSRQYYVRLALGELDHAAVEPLGNLLRTGLPHQQREAALALAHLRTYRSGSPTARRAGEVLTSALESRNLGVREAAAAALAVDFATDRYPHRISI